MLSPAFDNSSFEKLPPDGPARTPLQNSLNKHYEVIGQTLLICEASSWRVGIPWLPPTDNVVKYRKSLSEPLESFVQCSLVTVTTDALECYCDDLESTDLDDAKKSRLFLRTPPALERYALGGMVFVGLLALCFGLCFLARLSIGTGFGLAVVAALLPAIVAAACSSENSRISSFLWLLDQEILRRRGMKDPRLRRIPLRPAEQDMSPSGRKL